MLVHTLVSGHRAILSLPIYGWISCCQYHSMGMVGSHLPATLTGGGGSHVPYTVGKQPPQSSAYICIPCASCLKFDTQVVCLAFSRERAMAEKIIAARMVMIPMTTSNSMRVNPLLDVRLPVVSTNRGPDILSLHFMN